MADIPVRSPRTILTRRRFFALVMIAVVCALLALFVADNYVLIQIRLINIRIELRLAWALLLTFLAGGGAGYLLGWRRR